MIADIQKNSTSAIIIACPMCNSSMVIQNPIKVGTIYECQKCASESEVVDLDPLTITPIEEEK
ncbi:hypothetical protein A3D77_06935 [Candidatus Gottesmanbacteria bacterium RIFCSPHIGHO2_02_FULL_39_11]|uniref:Lysine biosynthesis protein LysW n=1 Tax=Candidatus Gottesmanbacteria bacterium RIFCSPHIGHO2_02_FULL_39_11 TaxID=1798382 RepID=A0A1F5ZKA7_9BACT|nr:MAG: hypothetical protein A3D77_06935 [Candidatus Gottesmanbacteria bacterium RIFCSPHIGHO2_02_FULL_39_11]